MAKMTKKRTIEACERIFKTAEDTATTFAWEARNNETMTTVYTSTNGQLVLIQTPHQEMRITISPDGFYENLVVKDILLNQP